MKKEGLQNLILPGHIEGNRVTNLMNLCKWMAEQEMGGIVKKTNTTESYKDMKLWRAMVAHA